jgi:hypothetical protein
MKYAVEMGSGAMIYITSFRHSKVDKEGIQRHTDSMVSHKPIFIFSK